MQTVSSSQHKERDMADTYLITGGTSDIGLELLRLLLAVGSDDDRFIVQGFSNLAAIEPLKREYPGRIEGFAVDLSNPPAVQSFIEAVQKQYGTISRFAHMPAMRMVYADFKDFDEERFGRAFQLQVGSAIAICKHIMPRMAELGRGRVLFILSSIIVGMPPMHCAAYSMLKHALHGLVKSLASDYAAHNVTVNAVAPSLIDTKVISAAPQAAIQPSVVSNPMPRNCPPAHLAPAMAFFPCDCTHFTPAVTPPISSCLVIYTIFQCTLFH